MSEAPSLCWRRVVYFYMLAECSAVWVALERAVRLCLQDGLSRYLLRGCGDGFPKWWLLKAIDEGRLHEPKNGNGCVVWVGHTFGCDESLRQLQVITKSWRHTSTMPCHCAAGLSMPCTYSCCVLVVYLYQRCIRF